LWVQETETKHGRLVRPCGDDDGNPQNQSGNTTRAFSNALRCCLLPILWESPPNPHYTDAESAIQRVGKRDAYLVVEAYRNEQEKVNLMYWQLTCRLFYTPSEWEWTFLQTG
jgi:hypothetical protein